MCAPGGPSLAVARVAGRRDTTRFITFPERLYRGYPCWVPPLRFERRRFLDPRWNPFFEHADVGLFLAVDGAGVVRGRIAAIVNFNHVETHREAVGFFGLFESENDPHVAHRLLDAAAAFLRDRGMTVMRGPANMSVNDDLGLLVDGYDSPPAIMMAYNPPYYRDLVEGYGFSPVMALYAYRAEDREGQVPERLLRGLELVRRRYQHTIRPIDMRRLDADAGTLHDVYTRAWEDNWGAVPLTPREFEHLTAMLKLAADPELCLVAEVEGEVAGFCLTLPDLNPVLARLGGRLFPFGLLKFLWYRQYVDGLRTLAMGVLKPYRNMGVDVCLYHETIARGLAKGYRHLEMSWILADNASMNLVLQKFGAEIAKTYQLYDYRL